jgi:hypothetical protein
MPVVSVVYTGQAQNIVWTAVSGNASATSSTISKSGPDGWDAGGYSLQSVGMGGYIQFQGGETNTYKMMGLNSDPAADNSYCSIDYAIYLAADGNQYIYENCGNPAALGPYATTDVFRVEWTSSNQIVYKKNGVVNYTSTITTFGNLVWRRVACTPTGASFTNIVMSGDDYAQGDCQFSPPAAPITGTTAIVSWVQARPLTSATTLQAATALPPLRRIPDPYLLIGKSKTFAVPSGFSGTVEVLVVGGGGGGGMDMGGGGGGGGVLAKQLCSDIRGSRCPWWSAEAVQARLLPARVVSPAGINTRFPQPKVRTLPLARLTRPWGRLRRIFLQWLQSPGAAGGNGGSGGGASGYSDGNARFRRDRSAWSRRMQAATKEANTTPAAAAELVVLAVAAPHTANGGIGVPSAINGTNLLTLAAAAVVPDTASAAVTAASAAVAAVRLGTTSGGAGINNGASWRRRLHGLLGQYSGRQRRCKHRRRRRWW